MSRLQIVIILGVATIGIIGVSLLLAPDASSLRVGSPIDPEHIRQFMQEQVDLGPRHPGAPGNLAFIDWIYANVPDGWIIEMQNYTINGIACRNYLITHESIQGWPSILIGAHYDTRKVADQDDDNPTDPVPGANDAASGVAAILEMMDHMNYLTAHVGFVLFDAEDQGYGGMSGWNYIEGSEYFASQMTESEINDTQLFILFDMIANDNMELEMEGFSDQSYRDSIWAKAEELGYGDIFIDKVGYHLIDDHRPFLNLGIRAVDLIDFNYPEWHTTKDTMANVSPENAGKVADTTLVWLLDNFQSLDNGTYSSVTPVQTIGVNSSTTDTAFPFGLFALLPVLIYQLTKNRRYLHSN